MPAMYVGTPSQPQALQLAMSFGPLLARDNMPRSGASGPCVIGSVYA